MHAILKLIKVGNVRTRTWVAKPSQNPIHCLYKKSQILGIKDVRHFLKEMYGMLGMFFTFIFVKGAVNHSAGGHRGLVVKALDFHTRGPGFNSHSGQATQ